MAAGAIDATFGTNSDMPGILRLDHDPSVGGGFVTGAILQPVAL